MLRRVESLLSVDMRRLMGGTFHSVGNRLLRRFGARLGLTPNFTILDPEDARETARGRDLGPEHSDARDSASRRATSCSTCTRSRSTRAVPFPEVLAEHAPHFAPARDGDRVASSSGTASVSAWATPATTTTCCFSGSASSTRAPRRPLSWRAATTTSSWTSTRTPTASRATSWTAWRGSGGTSRWSATTPRRSTPSAALRSRTSSASRERYPDAQTYPPDPELPLDARDPRARQRLDRAQRAPVPQGAAGEPGTAGPMPAVVALAGHLRAGALHRAAPARVARRGGEARRTSPCSTAPTTRRSSCRSS